MNQYVMRITQACRARLRRHIVIAQLLGRRFPVPTVWPAGHDAGGVDQKAFDQPIEHIFFQRKMPAKIGFPSPGALRMNGLPIRKAAFMSAGS
jgi:hypothetical protein